MKSMLSLFGFLLLSAACMAVFTQSAEAAETHQTARTQFVEVNGTKYAYRAFGKMAGPPLILLQHFTGTLDNWDPVVTDGLAEHFRVVLLDGQGVGTSGGQTPDTIEAMAHDTIGVIKALGFQKVNVLGFSMGGFIAQQMILEEPALIDKVILAGTGPKGGQGIADIGTPLTASAAMSPDEKKLYLFYTASAASRALGQRSLDRIHQRTKNRDKDADGGAIEGQLKAILNWGQADAQALNRLKTITQPVLIVNGSNDIVVPTINSYVLFANLPNAKLSLYPDAGHGAIYQHPAVFLTEAIAFLKAK